MNFKMAYITALGEIPNNREILKMMRYFSIEHITFTWQALVHENLNIEDLSDRKNAEQLNKIIYFLKYFIWKY
jgi:hypothetical protein